MQNLVTFQKSLYQSFSEQIELFLIKKTEGKRIVIWGAGVRGILAGHILESKGVNDFVYVDNAPEKQGEYLSGHMVKALREIEIEKAFFLLSMEYQESVKQLLAGYGMKEGNDFIGLHDSEVMMLMRKVTRKAETSTMIIGEQIMQTVPIDELKTKTLEELLEDEMRDSAKILGMPCLNMKTIYSLIKTELFQNPLCRTVVLLVDLKSLNSYNHLLPRTQKKELLVELKKYGERQKNERLVIELEDQINKAEERIDNFELENRYSPNRLYGETLKDKMDRMRDYIERCLLEPFDELCEEWMYLKKIIEMGQTENVKIILASDPLYMKSYDKLVGLRFREEYSKRSQFLFEQALACGAHYYNMSDLFGEEDFLSYHTPDDLLSCQGRQKFAKCVIDVIKDR